MSAMRETIAKRMFDRIHVLKRRMYSFWNKHILPLISNHLVKLRAGPHLRFEYPTNNYYEGENISVLVLPTSYSEYEITLTPRSGTLAQPQIIQEHTFDFDGSIPPGVYRLVARARKKGRHIWSSYSIPLSFTIHSEGKDVRKLKQFDHMLDLMLEKGIDGTITLIDPDAWPPNAMDKNDLKWFATPSYEGATPLMNEEEEYYRDPCKYYLDCIDALLEKGARFITWADIVGDNVQKANLEILLQFDVDAGPISMQRIYKRLLERDIRASLMIHRRETRWYPYEIEDVGLDWISDVENNGWQIGYHNNSLSQLGHKIRGAVYSGENLQKATGIFKSDINDLRKWFAVNTYTNHGGNYYNFRVPPPSESAVLGVDRYQSPNLWIDIQSMFSDGGFTSRPSTLKKKIKSLETGIHFMRNHPIKYANYSNPCDVPPRNVSDLSKAGLEDTPRARKRIANELNKERKWVEQRFEIRSNKRLSYLRLDKPISKRFGPDDELSKRVSRLRGLRGENFLRLYPWEKGDPRVYWWRMLDAWVPKKGSVLNVGALPENRKEENSLFLSPGVNVVEIDTDARRKPDYVEDIVDAPTSIEEKFAAVLLFGLPYFSRPLASINACYELTEPGGIGLFGFPSDTNPSRGSIWHPKNRILWSLEREPLEEIGLQGNLWSFDEESISELFSRWSEVIVEWMGHYWFVVGKKNA